MPDEFDRYDLAERAWVLEDHNAPWTGLLDTLEAFWGSATRVGVLAPKRT